MVTTQKMQNRHIKQIIRLKPKIHIYELVKSIKNFKTNEEFKEYTYKIFRLKLQSQ